MILPLSAWIGIRLSVGSSTGLRSMVSLISIFGISFGIAVLIIVLSTINGFEDELKKKIISLIPEIEIESTNNYFTEWQWQNIYSIIKKIPKISNITPYINFLGLLEIDKKMQLIQIKGVESKTIKKNTELSKFILGQNWENFQSNKKKIIIGKEIAKKFNLKVNDWINLMINVNKNNKFFIIKNINLQISGILQTNGILDYTTAFVPLEDAQKYLNIKNNYITGIAIKTNDSFNIKKILFDIENKINFNVYIITWMNKYGYIYKDITMIRTIIYATMSIIMIIAFFNNVSVLIMIVKEKNKEIAILKTLGAKNILINEIFLFYGLVIGFISSVIGMFIGIITSLNINKIIKILENFLGIKIFTSNIYFIDFFPSKIKFTDLVIILALTITLSIISSYYPAKRANKISLASLLNKN